MMPRGPGPDPLLRWKRLLTFDVAALHDVYRDTTATVVGLATVPVVMFLAGLGGLIWWTVIEDNPGTGDFVIESLVVGTLIATGLFYVWAGLVAAAAGQLGRGDGRALTATIRTLSYASTPFAVSFLIFLPGMEFTISLIAVSLLVVSTTQATQVALQTGYGRALGLNLFGFFVWASVLAAVTSAGHFYAPPPFLGSLPFG